MQNKSWLAHDQKNKPNQTVAQETAVKINPVTHRPQQSNSNNMKDSKYIEQSDPIQESTVNSTAVYNQPEYYQGRRRKAAVVLSMIWGGTITLHLVSWGSWFILGLTGLLSIHVVRLLLTAPRKMPPMWTGEPSEDWPFVSLLVAAKNEEAVIQNLVQGLCNLDYPKDCYEVWVIDDNSSDQTALLLEQMMPEYQQLNVLRRTPTDSGGKSGALNQVLPLTHGEIIGVFDADAQVSQDLLRRVLPLFEHQQVGGVQTRKAIANEPTNFWTRSQAAEMVLDTTLQQKRVALGGMGELRGNGQFVRRQALEGCGGWNEQTITDDLDLTFRLHLDQWDIELMMFPPVAEEGVTSAKALWHQRNRWAEGGYQRYLDYWQLILKNRMNFLKRWDLFYFLVFQYLLPTAAIPDCLMAILLRRPPITSPMTMLAVMLSCVSMFMGLRRTQKQQFIEQAESELTFSSTRGDNPETVPQTPYQRQPLGTWLITLLQTLRGTLYMFHWFIVIGSVTARISVRPKRLKWVKTVHQGHETAQ
jgi:1,2-diacylglycerol 3-beta-glucosyltransferase